MKPIDPSRKSAIRNPQSAIKRSLALAAMLALGTGTAASAATYYWDTTTTGSWSDGANWSDNDTSGGTTGTVPLSTDSAFFNQSSVNGAQIITLDAAQSITGITFNNTGTTTFRATAAAVTNQTLSLGTGGMTINSTAGNVTFSQTPATYGVLTIDTAATTQTWTNNATLLTTGPVTGSGQLTLTGANSSLVNSISQFSMELSGYTGSLILNNSRLVNQVATNGFGTTGALTINNGAQLGLNVASTTVSRSLSIAGNGWYDNSAVQRGAIRFLQNGTVSSTVTLTADARLVADNTRTGAFTGKITGGFGLQIGQTASTDSGGTISFQGGTANDYSGLTTVSSGTLSLNKSAGINAIAGNVLVTSGGTLSNADNNQIADTSTVSVDNNAAVWSLNGKTETIDTLSLSGTYTANKGFTTGVAGKLTVTNLNVSGGGVTLNSAGSGNQTTITATTVTNTGGTWVFGTTGGTQSLVIGSGGLTIGGGSTISVASSGNATTFISLGGNVTSQANAATNTISGGGQLRLNATRTFDVADGAAASDLTVSAVIANGTGTSGITKTGAGLMTLGGANTFTGGITIKEGTLLSTNAAAITSASSLTIGDSTGLSTTPATFDITTASVNYANPINVVGTNQVNTIRDTSFTLGLSGLITLTNADLTINQATTAVKNVTGGVTGTGNLILSNSGGGGSLNLTTAGVNHTGTITNNGSGASPTVISSAIGTNVTGVTQNSATSSLTLSGPNTYTGTTTIAAGILNAGIADGVGTGALGNGGNITFSGGRLQYSAASAGTDYSSRIKNSTGAVAIDTNGQSVTFASIIDSTNTLGLTKSGAGTLTLAAASANTYTGATAVTGGILAIANKDALNSTSGISVATGGATLRIDVPNATSTTIGSGKSISIAGNGDANFGALQGAASTDVTWAGDVVLAAGVISRIGGGSSGTMTVDGVISGADTTAGVLFSRAPNSTTLLTKVNTYTGDTQMYPGNSTVTLKMGIANAINSASAVGIMGSGSGAGSTAYFDLNGFNQNVRALLDTTGGDFVVTNSSSSNDAELKLSTTNTQTLGGWIQDGASKKISLVIDGVGAQVLQGINTFTGGTRIDGGTLSLGHATNTLADTGAVNVNGGTLALGNAGAYSDTVGAVTLTSGSITGTSGTLTGSGSNFDVRSGNITAKLGGGIGLDKSTVGTVTLSGANTYSGNTTITAGTLALTGAGSIASSANLKVNGILDVTGLTAGTFSVGATQSLSGSGSIEATGKTVSVAGTLAPGASIGTLSVNGGVTLVSGSTFAAQINTDPTPASDTLAVNGVLNLGGSTLTLVNLGTATPANGTKFTIASYTTLSGTFAGYADGATVTDGVNNYTLDYNDDTFPNTITLTAQTSATPYDTWAADKGLTAGVNDGDGDDPDADGRLNIEEFALDGDPLSAANDGKVVGKVATVGGDSVLTYTLPVRTGATFSDASGPETATIDGVVYSIQGSDDLSAWSLDVTEVTGGDETAIQAGLPALNSGWAYRTFRTPDAISADPSDYIRARIESNP